MSRERSSPRGPQDEIPTTPTPLADPREDEAWAVCERVLARLSDEARLRLLRKLVATFGGKSSHGG